MLDADQKQLNEQTMPALTLIAVLDRELRFLAIDDLLAAFHGTPAAAHLGRSVSEVLPSLAPHLEPLLRQVLDTGQPIENITFYGEVLAQHGSDRRWLASYLPVRARTGLTVAVEIVVSKLGQAGLPGGALATTLVRNSDGFEAAGFVLDNSEHKRGEAELRATKERLNLGIQLAGLAVAEVEYETGTIALSAEAAALYGLGETAMRVPLEQLQATFHPEERAQLAQAIAQALRPEGDGDFTQEHRVVWPDRQVRWLHVRMQVSFDRTVQPPRPAQAILVARDITRRKYRELNLAFLSMMQELFAPLRSADEIVRLVGEQIAAHFRAAHCLFVEVDETVQRANVFYDHHPAGVPDLAGAYKLAEFHTDAERQQLAVGNMVVVDDVRQPPRPQTAAAGFEALGICALATAPYVSNGRWAFALSIQHAEPHNWQSDEVELLQELASQIYLRLERAQVEEALRASEERFRSVFESIDEGFCIVELVFDTANRPVDYRFLQANPAFEQLTGLRNPVGGTARELMPDLEPFWFETYGRVALTGEAVRFQNHAQPLNRWFDVYASRVGGAASRQVAIVFNNITERRQAEEQLRESREFLNRITDIAPTTLYIYDLRETRNVWINHDAFEALGYSAAEVQELGSEVLPRLLHPEDVLRYATHYERLRHLQDDETAEFEYRMRHKDGTWRWLVSREMAFAHAEDGTVSQIVGAASDITDRKHAAEALADRERLLGVLLRVSDAARKLNREEDIARKACELVKREVGAISCSYGFVYPEEDRVRVVADVCDEGVPSSEGEWPLSGFGPDLVALHELGEPVVIEDTASHPATAAFQATTFDAMHTRSLIGIPLVRNRRFVAYFSIHDRLPRNYTEAEVTLLRSVAARVWDAIQRSRAEAELRDSEARQSLLLRLVEGQRVTNDPDAMTAATAEAVGRFLGADRVGFFEMSDDNTLDFGVSWTDGVLEPLSGTFPASGIGTRYLAEIRAGRTLGIADTATDPLTADSLFGTIGVRSIIGVPIIRGGRWRAGMYINHSEVRYWTDAEIALARDAGEQTWDAVERAQAQEALRESEARLQVLYEQEQGARAQAEEASRLKDEFLATVSHELRTPLTSILGYGQLIQSRKRDEAYIARTIDKMVRSAKVQAQLIEDLLDVSRIVSGKLRIEMQPTNLIDVIRAALDTVRPVVEAKGLNLEIDLHPEASAVIGDPNRLQQVVWNLLSNAAKFTPPNGSIYVRLKAQGHNAHLTISDTGQGISPEFLPYVFDRFRQAEATSNRVHSGLGLGLAIVRHLVELHGGTVKAISDGEGQGTTFSIWLPLDIYRRAAAMAGTEADQDEVWLDCPPELQGLRVLLVDDQQDILELLYEIMAPCGAVVRICSSAREGLDAVRAWHPDVLISDIAMPNEDGYWLIQRVRELPAEEGGAIPAIALTAYVRVEERVRVLAAGFQRYVPKPVEPGELRAVVASVARDEP